MVDAWEHNRISVIDSLKHFGKVGCIDGSQILHGITVVLDGLRNNGANRTPETICIEKSSDNEGDDPDSVLDERKTDDPKEDSSFDALVSLKANRVTFTKSSSTTVEIRRQRMYEVKDEE